MLCNLLKVNQHLRGTCHLHLHLQWVEEYARQETSMKHTESKLSTDHTVLYPEARTPHHHKSLTADGNYTDE
jgi:hypothetical protein